MSTKLPPELDDPVDTFLYKICERISPAFHASGHTPNLITTYSLLTGLAGCYALYHGRIILFVILMIASYFFDCFDGYFARKYGMTSEFGDIYDHSKDAFVSLIMIWVVMSRYYRAITWWNITLVVVLFVLFMMHMGCQQDYTNDKKKNGKDSETIDIYRKLCRSSDDLPYTRFFGPGMFFLYYTLIIVYVYAKYAKAR